MYRFFDDRGTLLYIGKAKNLQARLRQYRLAKSGQDSRKTLRLVRLIARVEWQLCDTEENALLLENHCLRTERPPFNVLNTRPDLSCFVAIRQLPEEIRFRWTHQPKRQGDQIYGAFKGRRVLLDGLSGLMRLLWLSQTPEIRRWELPPRLLRPQPPRIMSVPARPSEDWFKRFHQFFSGTDRGLLDQLTESLLARDDLHPFFRGWIQQDLESAALFYERGPLKNRQFKKQYRLRGRLIPQDRLDDLITLDLVARSRAAPPTGESTSDS